jgi:hypothetical protein
MYSKLVVALQAIGAVTMSVGIGMVFIPAGIISIGLFAILFGIAIERR